MFTVVNHWSDLRHLASATLLTLGPHWDFWISCYPLCHGDPIVWICRSDLSCHCLLSAFDFHAVWSCYFNYILSIRVVFPLNFFTNSLRQYLIPSVPHAYEGRLQSTQGKYKHCELLLNWVNSGILAVSKSSGNLLKCRCPQVLYQSKLLVWCSTWLTHTRQRLEKWGLKSAWTGFPIRLLFPCGWY